MSQIDAPGGTKLRLAGSGCASAVASAINKLESSRYTLLLNLQCLYVLRRNRPHATKGRKIVIAHLDGRALAALHRLKDEITDHPAQAAVLMASNRFGEVVRFVGDIERCAHNCILAQSHKRGPRPFQATPTRAHPPCTALPPPLQSAHTPAPSRWSPDQYSRSRPLLARPPLAPPQSCGPSTNW